MKAVEVKSESTVEQYCLEKLKGQFALKERRLRVPGFECQIIPENRTADVVKATGGTSPFWEPAEWGG